MIVCVIGTRAQLIKMAPVILECERRSWPIQLVMTGQHRETMDDLLAEFNIRTPSTILNEAAEITSTGRMGFWFLRSLWRCLTTKDIFPSDARHSVFIVHGDTASTLLGTIAGKLLGSKVAHVEAGLRSGNLLHPFPEELIRRLVSHFADYAFCPGKRACKQISHQQCYVVDTLENTLVEAVSLVMTKPQAEKAGSNPYGVVSIHRFENIFFRGRLQRILELIDQASEQMPLLFVLHPATRARLDRYNYMERLQANPRITLMDRMAYHRFIPLLANAQFVITDGGSNQEELSYLGVPTLVMRKATERHEGMTSTARLCHYDAAILRQFLNEAKPQPMTVPLETPSHIILDALASFA